MALEELLRHAFRADVTLGVGPVKGRYKAEVELTDLDPPQAGYARRHRSLARSARRRQRPHVTLEPTAKAARASLRLRGRGRRQGRGDRRADAGRRRPDRDRAVLRPRWPRRPAAGGGRDLTGLLARLLRLLGLGHEARTLRLPACRAADEALAALARSRRRGAHPRRRPVADADAQHAPRPARASLVDIMRIADLRDDRRASAACSASAPRVRAGRR